MTKTVTLWEFSRDDLHRRGAFDSDNQACIEAAAKWDRLLMVKWDDVKHLLGPAVEPTGAQRHVDEIVPAAALPPELQGLADSFAKAFGNSPRRIEPDIREKVFGNAAGTMARKLDAAIADALNRFLPDGWTMDDVKRRCVRVKGPNSDVETLCMDGVPLLEIHPIEMERVPNETGFSVRFTQKYRDLKPLNRGAPRE
jgi:hypothetical protein